jgi:sugar phosphate isomerase/epimerase
MRVSFSTGTYYHRSLAYSLRLAAETGFDGVELVVGPEYLMRGLEPLRHAVRLADVPVLSVHPPFFRLPGWPRPFAQAIPALTSITRELGAELAVVHTPLLTSEQSPRTERFATGLRLGLEAGGPQTQLTIENSQYADRKRRYVLDDLRTVVRFAQAHGCGVTFDTCHAGANGEELMACYEIVRPVLRNVHLSDVSWHNGRHHTHLPPGEGELPLGALLAALARDGYTGLVTLEIHPRYAGLWSRVASAQRLRKALTFVRAAAEAGTPARTSPGTT